MQRVVGCGVLIVSGVKEKREKEVGNQSTCAIVMRGVYRIGNYLYLTGTIVACLLQRTFSLLNALLTGHDK